MLSPRFLRFSLIYLVSALAVSHLRAVDSPPGIAAPASSPAANLPSSDDSIIANFHSLGKIDECGPVYRCASPVKEIGEGMKMDEPTSEELRKATQQMEHLHELGVRTVVSLQVQDPLSGKKANPEYRFVALEKAAAKAAGIKYVGFSMANLGKNSLQDMDTETVAKLVKTVSDEIIADARDGGVAFHCKSGKDRTGLIAAYLRIKYQHWSLEEAIAEMRKYGHVWKKFLRPGKSSSWHEDHLRAITEEAAAGANR